MKRTSVREKPTVHVVLSALVAASIAASGCMKSDNSMKLLSLLLAKEQRISIEDALPSYLSDIPQTDIEEAKAELHIAYGHTSHGSQLVTGMDAIAGGKGSLFAFNSGGTDGALDLRDGPFEGASDLGNPDRTEWEAATRSYLGTPDSGTGRGSGDNADINVVIWSWCGQVSSATEGDITTYLNLMEGLEADYPGITFVYMTGHTDGSGFAGNLHVRNDQIRNYCSANSKMLFDFETIESYDPTSPLPNYFGSKFVDDGCWYDSNGDESRDANWARQWVRANRRSELSVLAAQYCGECAHSENLNCVMKGVEAWKLWVQIAAAIP